MTDRKTAATRTSPSRRQLLVTASAGSFCGWGLPLLAQTTGITLPRKSTFPDEQLFHTKNLQQFVREVASQSQSALQIEVVSHSKLMPMKDVLPALSKGDLAIGEIFMSNFAEQTAVCD